MFGKRKPPQRSIDAGRWLRKDDLPDFFEKEPVYELIEVKQEDGFPRSLRFKHKQFEQTLTVASLIGNDYDVDRAWLTAAFGPNRAVDVAFANAFNRRQGLACAWIDESGGCQVHAHFPLCGLKKRDAELMLAVHIGRFNQDLVELNKMQIRLAN